MRKLSKEHKRKIALAHIGTCLSEETKRKKGIAMKKWWSIQENRKLMSNLHIGNKGYWKDKKRDTPWMEGEKNRQWRGGVYKFNYADRTGGPYKKWRREVLKRDGKCIACGSIKNLETDHIKPFALYPELRFAIDNGRTLCKLCHLIIGAKLLGRDYKFLSQYDDA